MFDLHRIDFLECFVTENEITGTRCPGLIPVVSELVGLRRNGFRLDLPEPIAVFRHLERRIDVAGHFDFENAFFSRQGNRVFADDDGRRLPFLIDRDCLLAGRTNERDSADPFIQ